MKSILFQTTAIGIGLVVCLEFLIPIFIYKTPILLLPWDRIEARKEVLEKPTTYDVLTLGDSTAVQSVIPSVFTKITGLSMYNFATYSDSGYINDLYFLKGYLEKHPSSPPKAVFVFRSIHSWNNGVNQNLFSVFRKKTPDIGISWKLYTLGYFSLYQHAFILLESVFPSLYNREIVAAIREAAFNENIQRENAKKRYESPGYDGYEPFDLRIHNYNLQLDEKNLQYMHSIHDKQGNIIMNESRLELLQYLCEISSAYRIPVFITSAPYANIIDEDPQVSKAVSQISIKVNEALSAYPNCRYINSQRHFDNAYLSDLTHANDAGANIFTAIIAKDYMNSWR